MRRVAERRPGMGRIQFEELGYVSVGPNPDLPAGTKLACYSETDTAVYDVEVKALNIKSNTCMVMLLEDFDGFKQSAGFVFEALLSDLFWHPPPGTKPMEVFEPIVLERNIHCDRGCDHGITKSRFLCTCVRARSR